MRMLKVAHTRPHAGETAARGLVGVPSDELRFLVGQQLAGFGLAACLFLSLVADLAVFLGADVDAQNHRACTLTNACVSAKACQRVACSSIFHEGVSARRMFEHMH